MAKLLLPDSWLSCLWGQLHWLLMQLMALAFSFLLRFVLRNGDLS